MTNFHTIDAVGPEAFMITWDLGRRCNFDCSYCPPHRHDNFSPHASLDELKSTVDFVFDYAATLAEYRHSKDFHISFTGGEPTVHPKFIEFARYVSDRYTNYKDQFNLQLDLTTNGAMSERIADAVIETFDYVTVSYHTEAHSNLKKQCLDRIKQFKDNGINIKVNVMFHADHFEECQRLCEWFKEQGIRFIPRTIGEDPGSKSSHAYKYTEEQTQWFKQFWSTDSELGRPCCGGRTFKTCGTSETKEVKFISYRKFKDWYCSVNWFFLHIEQQTGLVYHHQTCQAKFDGTRGPIGNVNEGVLIVKNLKEQLSSKTMPIIVCPNTFCGCGLCTPKSTSVKQLIEILPTSLTTTDIFN